MDEASLISQAQKGDLDAFNFLLSAYQQRAYNLAYRIMGEADAAADITQEAFISAFRGIRWFRGGSFASWLLRIVTNACYDEFRRRKRRPSLSLESMGSSDSDDAINGRDMLVAPGNGPERQAERSELARAIQDCLDRLPPEFRAVAVLADVQGYDYGEVSQAASVPVGTVKSRLARARARLRDCLQRYRELLPESYRLKDE